MRRETREKRRVREPKTRTRVKVAADSRQEFVMKARGMNQDSQNSKHHVVRIAKSKQKFQKTTGRI